MCPSPVPQDPALVSNYSNYEPYERLKAVDGFIKWPNDTGYTFPLDSVDDDGAILGYVRMFLCVQYCCMSLQVFLMGCFLSVC